MDSNRNTGDRNTGHYNTGDRNTGHYNTGHRNTGFCNTGHYNTGDRNTGHRNTGDRNTGHRNTGHYNTGDRNTGHYNTGHRNTGFFCTESPTPMFFDRPTDLAWDEAFNLIPFVELPVGAEWVPLSDMTEEEKNEHPNHVVIGGFLRKHNLPIQEAFPKVWANMPPETKDRFLHLPNFDAEKFLACTGVDVRVENHPTAAIDDEIVLNGIRYRRVDQ